VPAPSKPPIHNEFSGVDLKDKRLETRLVATAQAVAAAPGLSFPKLMPSRAELEAFYRLMENPRVQWLDILQPHVEATSSRCGQYQLVYVAHDTTEFAFGGLDRADDIGHLQHDHSGFFGHFGLAVGASDKRPVLGVLGVSTWHRDKAAKLTAAQRKAQGRAMPAQERESARWVKLVDQTTKALNGTAAIHVMDREADDFALLSQLSGKELRFVIRAAGDRRLESEYEVTLQQHLAAQPDVLFREVVLGARAKKQGSAKRWHPPRALRPATLHLRAAQTTLRKPSHLKDCPQTLPINVVQVFEPNPPEGEQAISWTLMTTEPIDTADQRAAIVDAYRARWRIEEFFKALKTGCAYEKRQLESEHTLLNALALLIPVAWRLMALRDASRETPQEPATDYLTAPELTVLRVLSKRVKLGADPTIEEAVLAIAGVGGHLKQNGPPGWKTISLGYHDLRIATLGWQAAQRSDQS
jgi:hypothetical protein